ncbi:MAG: DNA repair protein RecN [Rhodobiaceae bacterium]|nr:DNA repair protein RecN [Rhodobiaceae bacterium]MCC0012021.1 DNA repair protein RecN [Rhodobiaceae bacterium]MCC0051487.1 DNA repair protein RecN [Rhodobiaceae bacterium]MCC0061063.1 DNA repair protein RecN [Rhodobiaceae bacterium]
MNKPRSKPECPQALARLSIRDIVLIDAIDLDFGDGFTVLTGETGAGKSILLDAFALALGARGDASLVRPGTEQGQVTAVFDLAPDHAAMQKAREAGFDTDGGLILRRVQSADGRTRAFLNDQPVSVQLLREIGAELVEIHGQHDERALVDPATHRGFVDSFGGLAGEVAAVRAAHARMQSAQTACEDAAGELEAARRDADFLTHACNEIDALDPQPGEEETLAERRQRLMAAEKVAGDLNEALEAVGGSNAPTAHMASVLRKLERRGEETRAILDPVVQGLSRALEAIEEARLASEAAIRDSAFDPADLEQIEERLFALRGLARKHSVQVHDLPALKDRLHGKRDALEAGEARLVALEKEKAASVETYRKAAVALSAKRRAAAEKLDAAVNAELPELKLERARFFTEIETADGAQGGASGIDQIVFHVQTNPGSMPGPLMKVASGGELARFLLALKVALAGRGGAPTLVFDEIDTAVSGAVSQAIGARLERLAGSVQVLAVTHAPQVAARASHHFLIGKSEADGGKRVVTDVSRLDDHSRGEEVARMLAGATVTDEARAAARRLMHDTGAAG